MKKKYNAFSLMEMMVVLLIVAIVAAASAPMVNKKVTSLHSDGDCQWNKENAGISYNSAALSGLAVMIGSSDRPVANTSLYIESGNKNFITMAGREGSNPVNLVLSPGSKSVGITNEGIGSSCVAIGYDASANNGNNVAVGQGARATGSNAVALGTGAQATSNNSVAIGSGVTAGDRQIVLGNNQSTVFIPGNLRVNGRVELGASGNPVIVFSANNNAGTYRLDTMEIGGRRLFVATNNNATLPSDRRLKNVGEKFTSGLEDLNKLEIFNYTYKKDEAKTPHVGVIAQDLMKIFPNAVTKGEDGYYRIRMEDMFYTAVNSIKELDAKITEIKEQVVAFVDRVTAVETTVNEFKATVESQQKMIEEQQKIIEAQQKSIDAQQKALDDLTKKVEKISKKKAVEETKAEVKAEAEEQ